MCGVAFDKPFEAVLKADDIDALLNRLDGYGTNDAVESGAGPPPTSRASLPGIGAKAMRNASSRGTNKCLRAGRR